MSVDLARLVRATKARERSEVAWHEAICELRAEGASLRQLASAAGVSHVRVLQIVRGHAGT